MANDLMNPKGNSLVVALDGFFAKAPELPKGGKDALVAVIPWLALIFGILGVITGLGVVGISPVGGMFGGVHAGTTLLVSGVLAIVSSVLMLMAYPKLTKHLMAGWMLLFWSEAVNVLSSLLAGSIVGAIIGALIGFYLLFQIKSYYK